MTTLRLAVVTDSHLCSPETPYGFWHNTLLLPESWRLWDEALDVINDADVDAVLLLGDVTNFAEPDILARALRKLADLRKPTYVVAGNHDVGHGRDAVERAVEALKEPTVTSPTFTPYSISGFPDFLLAGVAIAGDTSAGYRIAHPIELSTVASAADLPLILMSHYPVIDCRSDFVSQGLKYPDDLRGAADLYEALSRREPPTIILHGHLHRQHSMCRAQILQLGMAPLVEWPHAATFLTLRTETAELSVERAVRRVRGEPGSPRSRPTPRPEHWMLRNGRWIAASHSDMESSPPPN